MYDCDNKFKTIFLINGLLVRKFNAKRKIHNISHFFPLKIFFCLHSELTGRKKLVDRKLC